MPFQGLDSPEVNTPRLTQVTRRLPALRVVGIAGLAWLMAVQCGCNRAPAPPPTPLKAGASVFHFDFETVTDLLILRFDPDQGKRWTARLGRSDPKSPDWEIRSVEGQPEPLDRRADGPFILHLLDTLHTLQLVGANADASLPSLGLEPPRYGLQWVAAPAGDASKQAQAFELRIGSSVPGQDGSYASIPGHGALVVRGAALQMLEYIQSFDTLRLKTWAGITLDDVDEIQIFRSGRVAFFAQREGAHWTDRKHRRLRKDISPWLEALARARVLSFIDERALAEKLRSEVQAQPSREAILKDRHGKVTRLWAGAAGGKIIGLSSARPEGVFEIYPATLQALAGPPAF